MLFDPFFSEESVERLARILETIRESEISKSLRDFDPNRDYDEELLRSICHLSTPLEEVCARITDSMYVDSNIGSETYESDRAIYEVLRAHVASAWALIEFAEAMSRKDFVAAKQSAADYLERSEIASNLRLPASLPLELCALSRILRADQLAPP